MRAAWADAKVRLLRSHGLDRAQWLGEGEEAEVYRLGPERVLRICKSDDAGLIERRRTLLASLDGTTVSFEIPRILDQGELDGLHYAIERRIAGTALIDALRDLEGDRRQRALEHYADAAAAIRRIRCPVTSFGEILTECPLQTATWESFVLTRAETCLSARQARVHSALARPQDALMELERRLAQRGPIACELVHGDYHPANVIVASDGRVAGLLDFGHLTLMGDARLDQAGALLYLTGLPGLSAGDRKVVERQLMRSGLDQTDVELYKLFFGFRFLDTPRPGLFAWCIETLRSAC